MDLMTYISDKTVILIPVLYYIGTLLKNTQKVKDAYIPIILLPIGIALSMLLMREVSGTSLIQGILTTAGSTYANQIYKQFKNNKDVT